MYRFNQKTYKLINLNNGNSITLDGENNLYEPSNYKETEYTYQRSVKNFSETRTFSKAIKFSHGAAEFLRGCYLVDDVESNVEFFEIRYNPQTAIPYDYFIGNLDFLSYEDEINYVSVNLFTGGLSKLIKSKGKEKYEIDRKTDINGNEISVLPELRFYNVPRPIPLDTLLENSKEDTADTDDDSSSSVFRMRFGSQKYLGFYSLPFNIKYSSDENIDQVPNGIFNVIGASTDLFGKVNFEPLQNNRLQLFYYNNDRDRELKLQFDLSLFAQFRRNNNLTEKFGSLVLVTFEGGENPFFQIPVQTFENINQVRTLDSFTELANLDTLINGTSQNVNYNTEIDFNLLQGQSLGLFVVGGGDFDVTLGAAALDLDFKDIDVSIQVKEDSFIDDIPRNARCFLNSTVGDRHLEILTGEKDRYVSSFFESDKFRYTALTSGELLRGLPNATLTTSLNDFLDNCSVLFNTGYNIERIKGKDVLVHEDLKHFFRNERIVKLGKVDVKKRYAAKEFIHSSISLGFKKPSEGNLYEDVQGLTEFNVQTQYSTPITVTDSEYTKLSPYRADSEGKELTVRQHRVKNPDGDYRTDKDIFNLDLINPNGNLRERIYSDDFDQEPENVYSPETVTGLRFKPSSILKRHAWVINSAFTKFNSKFIRYASSIGNSLLKTFQNGEETQENQDFQISSLENPIFVSQWVEFDYPLSFEELEAINGTTLVNNREIPNTYFKISYINEFNEVEYGYLFELKPNQKNAKFKILKV